MVRRFLVIGLCAAALACSQQKGKKGPVVAKGNGITINHRPIGNEEFFTVIRTGLASVVANQLKGRGFKVKDVITEFDGKSVDDVQKFRRKPPSHCQEDAVHHKAIRYMRLQRSLTDMRACLADHQPFTQVIR